MEEQIQETEEVSEGLSSLLPNGGNAMTSIQNAANPGAPISNILEQQETAKGASEAQLIQYATSPQPQIIAPYLVTAELLRRKANREQQVKAPNFTVAQEAVASAEQGLMNQIKQQAPNMPAGGYTPPREEVTRETIMKEGIAPLPNPGNAMGQGGMAQGGIVGFIEGGPTTYTGRGAYMPQVKGKDAIQQLIFADSVIPQYDPGLYQDYNLDQGRSLEEYQTELEAIGPSSRDGLLMSQPQDLIPFGFNTIENKKENLRASFETPYSNQVSKLENQMRNVEIGSAEYQDIRDEYKALKQQEDLFFDDMSDAQIKQRRELGLPTGEEVKVDKSLTDKDGKITEKGSLDETITDGDKKEILEEDFSFTRLNPEDESNKAIAYVKSIIGEDSSLSGVRERLMELEEKNAKRFAKDRNMNVSEAFFEASREAAKPGGINVGNIISAGGSPFIKGKRRIDEAEEKAAMANFGLESDIATKEQARRDKILGRGVDAYTRAGQYNQGLEKAERLDATTREKNRLAADNTLALNRINYDRERDDKNDMVKAKLGYDTYMSKVLKGQTLEISEQDVNFARNTSDAALRDMKEGNFKNMIMAAKVKLKKIEAIARNRFFENKNTQIASNAIDYNSIK